MPSENKVTKKEAPKVKLPVCPYCRKTMEPFKFSGYYDAFCGWSCDCDPFPDGVELADWHGEYA